MGLPKNNIFFYIINPWVGDDIMNRLMKADLKDYGSGAFMRIIREWTGLTQKEFGKAIGRSERTIQDYEAGTTNYNVKTLEKITEKFNIVIVTENRSSK